MRRFTFDVLRAPERQGPQSATRTFPALPGLPRWTCAAAAFPVRPRNVRRQERVPPVPRRVSPALKMPRARALTPVGLGTSLAALAVAVNASAAGHVP